MNQTLYERGGFGPVQRSDYGPPSAAFDEVQMSALPNTGCQTSTGSPVLAKRQTSRYLTANGCDLIDDGGVDAVGLELRERFGDQGLQLRGVQHSRVDVIERY